MRIEVRGRNIQVTEALKDYAEKRLSKLERFIDENRVAHVSLSVEGDSHRVEVTIPLNGVILRGEEDSEDMYRSVDLVVDKLERQINKHKTKLYRRYRGAGLKKLVSESLESKEKVEEFKIVRTKRFALKPMDVEEAVMQMNLLGHNFFVFFNADSEEVNVVYCRRDGNYGLIEPEFE
ncbi:MAG: ribosome-associated translation inhibitor RaiA [Syntrophomonadaceae bacterium]|jgi:putative sigma-54 modulation protein|nr:ribosome-associated translation inhibitor RaiA [Syntrophomonadaceae bacterium]